MNLAKKEESRKGPRIVYLSRELIAVGFRPPYLFSFEIFLEALFRGTLSANQRNFCVIIAV